MEHHGGWGNQADLHFYGISMPHVLSQTRLRCGRVKKTHQSPEKFSRDVLKGMHSKGPSLSINVNLQLEGGGQWWAYIWGALELELFWGPFATSNRFWITTLISYQLYPMSLRAQS